MSYTRRFALALGPAWPGIAADIRAQLIDDAGANVGAAQSGAVEIGGGNYIMTVSAADGWMGYVKFYSAVEASLIIPVAVWAMAEIHTASAGGNIVLLDLSEAYIPFAVQITDADGAAADPTSISLIVYEDDGTGSTWPVGTITGSPFTPAKIADKLGYYGVRIAKTAFAAGKTYRFLWTATVGAVESAKQESIAFALSSDMKADVSGLSTFDPTTASVDVGKVAGVAVAGVEDFRATGFSTHAPGDVRTELATELARVDVAVSSRLAAASYTAPPDANSIATAVWAATTRTLSGFGTLVSDVATAVWAAATRTLSAFGFAVETDAASRAASKADVSTLATTARIDSLQAHGDTAWATGSTAVDVSAIADAVWDEALAGHVAAGSAGAKLGDQANPPSQTLADYRADVSALATSAGLAAMELHGDTAWAPADVAGIETTTDRLAAMIEIAGAVGSEYDRWLATALELAPDTGAAPTVEEIRNDLDANSTRLAHMDANISGLPTADENADAVLTEIIADHTAVEGSVAEALARLDTNVSSITVGEVEVSVDASTIHDALNSWTPETSETPPPIILAPPFAEDCRIWAAAGQMAGGQGPPEDIGDAYCQIVALPYYKGGRYWMGQQLTPTYDPEAGTLYWDVVRGATVTVYVREIRLRRTFQVPDGPTYEIPPVT